MKLRIPALVTVALMVAAGGLAWKTAVSGPKPRDAAAVPPPLSANDSSPGDPRSARPGVAKTHTRPQPAVLSECLALQVELRRTDGMDLEVLDRLRNRLDGLDPDEILALLEAVDASRADAQVKSGLASLIGGSLARRDPALALDVFLPRLSGESGGSDRQLGIFFSMWVSRDAAAASTWLERRTLEGAFRSDDPALAGLQARCEARLLRAEAAGDPAAAAARWQGLTEAERREVLGDDWFSGVPAEKRQQVVGFLRERSGPEGQALAQAASKRLRQGDLDGAADFIASLNPSTAERGALVAEALETRISGGVQMRVSPQEARSWIIEQAPDDAERLTGSMLGRFVEWYDFSEMAELARGFAGEAGTDAVLVAFLKAAPERSREAILELAASIEDPVLRREITARFPAPPGPAE